MNETIQNIHTRRAIRRYQNRQVDEALLEQILDAALHAPSAGNNQYSRIVVCQDSEINLALGKLSRYMQFKGADPAKVSHSISAEQPSIQDDHALIDGFYHAPTVLTIFVRDSAYAHDDAAMIAANAWLAAHSLGLGACYIGRTDEVFATEYGMELRRQWQIPEDMVAACNVLLGYLDGPAPHAKPIREGRIVRVK